MTKALDLKSTDLGISENLFCQLIGKQNCLISNPTETRSFVNNPTKNVSSKTRSIPTTTGSTVFTKSTSIFPEKNDEMFQSFEIRYNNIFDESEIETFREKITCDGIIASGPAASSFYVEELESWTPKEIMNCIDVLGSIDWTVEKKIDFWKYAISKVVENNILCIITLS
jgi:hypothetical protein